MVGGVIDENDEKQSTNQSSINIYAPGPIYKQPSNQSPTNIYVPKPINKVDKNTVKHPSNLSSINNRQESLLDKLLGQLRGNR